MSELGQQLREARLEKGMSLDDVQEMTKIRKRYLEAIEAGDYKVLPGNFYVRAFIKTYAETVGLNPDELLEGHKEVSLSQPEETMEPVIQKRSSNRPPTERNVKWLSTVLMWTFPILIIVVIYLYVSSLDEKPGDKTVDSGQKITGNIQDPKEPTDNGGDVTNTPDTNGGTDETVEPPVEEPPVEEPPVEQPVTVTEAGKSGKKTIFNVSGTDTTPIVVEIKATGKSWVEIYRGSNTKGEKLYFGNTSDGETLKYEMDSQGLFIKSGYSPATTITVAGQIVTDGKSTSNILLQRGTTNQESDPTNTETNTDTNTNTDSVE
ncbi:helix-turn-helix domain-containing protein [Paenibacillus glacialis]|uniref:XRE family transcriptional regulator n=1 Tax=Paenibacillus glacialis TaxID=494026 RepID=A0A168K1L9_9BACL|nr:RodZ domain-containing protein [Paenibacillus glacialis]OAB41402.1 XRE family transcriptional regulator [Paenibacillus glacialis]